MYVCVCARALYVFLLLVCCAVRLLRFATRTKALSAGLLTGEQNCIDVDATLTDSCVSLGTVQSCLQSQSVQEV